MAFLHDGDIMYAKMIMFVYKDRGNLGKNNKLF